MIAQTAAKLSENFGETLVLKDVRLAPWGRHVRTGRHYVATTIDNRRFGIKAIEGNSDVEELTYKLARLVSAPHAPDTIVDSPGAFPWIPPLNGLPVLKVEWLSGGSAALSQPGVIEDLQRAAEKFLWQFGEWTAFGLWVKVPDRDNLGNWVWDGATCRLLMVDFENCFEIPRRGLEFVELLRRAGFPSTQAFAREPTEQPGALERGFLSMRARIRVREEAWRSIVDANVAFASSTVDLAEFAKSDDQLAFALLTQWI